MAGTVEGIDVSNHNGTINWQAVHDAGILFAYCKATEGGNFLDATYKRNVAAARAAGVLVGGYHYFRRGDPQGQARHFLNTIGKLENGDLPPALDYEEVECNRQEAHVWIDTVEQALGRQVLLYTYKWFWIAHEGNSSDLRDHPLWYAQYSQAPDRIGGWDHNTIWQYSSTGHVPGISTIVDRNRWNGSYEQLQALAGIQAPQPPPPLPPSPAGAYLDPVTNQYVEHGFLAYLQTHPYLGHPLTGEYQLTLEDGKDYTVQLFERGMLQYRAGEQVGEARVGFMYQQVTNRRS